MKDDLQQIVGHFKVGECIKIEAFGSGLVHQSFKVSCADGKNYLLQRINSYVFRKPHQVMENIVIILDHLEKELSAQNQTNIDVKSLKIIPSKEGRSYVEDESNELWRMYDFIENSLVFDTAEYASQAYEAAKMFGAFGKNLSDLDPGKIHVTIPHFHDLDYRYQQLDESVDKAESVRKAKAREDIEWAFSMKHVSDQMDILMNEKKLPVRITHNDTKINNVLMDRQTGKGLCVIDLDTVMPSTVLSDFGDMVRTFTPSVSEEEADIAKLEFRLPIFKSLTEGYLSEARFFLTDIEKESLVFGGIYMILMQGVRFLADYLSGDVYYKVKYDQQNLNRARNQFILLKKILEYRDDMERIVREYGGY